MLQEAVDALFDNGRRGRAVTGPGNRPLKSLSDMLKGKQGRFRQNLLGKRVDYSGRSVIVSGPTLKLHQCGLPKLMALELFKPFIMSRLVERKAVQNIKAAKKMVDSMVPEVWDVLEEVIAEHPVLLNRAPTLHRLGIQAFEPILVEGKAIQVHPLVCHAFNADFDGDQMAGAPAALRGGAGRGARAHALEQQHPLAGTRQAAGDADTGPGHRHLLPDLHARRQPRFDRARQGRPAASLRLRPDSVSLAVSEGHLGLQETIWFRRASTLEKLVTTAGRVLFNNAVEEALLEAMGDEFDIANHEWINTTMRKSEISDYVSRLVDVYGASQVAPVLDAVKDLGFLYATQAGISISKNDIVTPDAKGEILGRVEKEVADVGDQYQYGLITDSERHEKVVILWGRATDEVEVAMRDSMWRLNPIYMMAHSGARGSFKQIRQLAGMRGLMANPKGEIIERPIKANFMEGLSVLEYFISTHGARKGLADTALRTADSGYLTRRLVDVSQDVIIREDDCGTDQSIEALLFRSGRPNRALVGRVLAEEIELGGEKVPANTPLSGEIYAALLEEHDESSDLRLRVRSVLKCESEVGVCRSCYGFSLATGEMSEIGDAVGIIAAQSIGEPGTQLTMRTFHEGGVAGSDITHGLPRVVELFEARNPKGAAVLSQIAGVVTREDTERGARITVTPDAPSNGDEESPVEELYQLPRRTIVLVRSGDRVGTRPAAHGGPAQSGRAAVPAAGRPDGHGALHRERGHARVRVPRASRSRQAHRADRAPDAQEGPRRRRRRHPLPARPAGRSRAHPAREPARRGGEERRHGSVGGRSSSVSPRRRWRPRASSRRPPSRRPRRCSRTRPSRARSTASTASRRT